jgi:hypothetical protein
MSFTTDAGLIVYEREDWGALQPRGGYASRGALTHASIHHGGPVGAPRMTKDEAVETCRSWQRYHMFSNGWTDIGYTFLIDGRGRLYEGRPVWALCAAVGMHNTGQISFNFMQDGRYYELTDMQRPTLKILFEVGIPRLNVPPLKRLATHSGDNWGVFSHNEYDGHETNECAGDEIIRHLRWRRGQYD